MRAPASRATVRQLLTHMVGLPYSFWNADIVRWEAETVGRVLGTRATALVCVHGAHVQGGGLHAQGVAIVPAHLLRGALGDDRVLSDADVRVLATTACTRLRPAA